jgi:small subunit ribosomal protein S21
LYILFFRWISRLRTMLSRFFYPYRLKTRRRGGDKMTIVTIRQNESQDSLLKRFRKKVVKSGVLSTVRRKRWFVSRSELRRIERKKAIRRIKRRQTGKVYEPTV